MKRGDDYAAFKERLSQRLLERLYEQLPQLRGKVDRYELSTPLSTRHFCHYPHGEAYGLAHTPQRFRQRYLRPATPIRGLYLTGQDIFTCGLGGALAGGLAAASAILRRQPGDRGDGSRRRRATTKKKDLRLSPEVLDQSGRDGGIRTATPCTPCE